MKVSGIIRQTSDDSSNIQISGSVGYTKALTNYLINYGNKSDIVKAQKNSPDVNVLNGLHFNPDNDSIKLMMPKLICQTFLHQTKQICGNPWQ